MNKTKEKWPKTVEEAVEQLLSLMSEKDKQNFRKTPKKDLIMFHFSLGLYIRNNFGLWQGNRELLQSINKSDFPLVHPDDASSIIIEKLWKRLRQAK